MTYDGREVANFILDKCDAENREVSNLALQKLVYFCHVRSLTSLGKPLIKHKFEAWEFGPVLPYLYREFKSFDRSGITRRAHRINSIDGTAQLVKYDFDKETQHLLEETLKFYGRLRPSDLVRLSHVEGGPWHKVWNHKKVINPGMKIDDDEIAAFYSRAPEHFSIQ